VSPELAEQVRLEMSAIERLLAEHAELFDAVATRDPSVWERSALAAVLHSFYNAVENILKRVARGGGIEVAEGPNWHARLVDALSVRPGAGGLLDGDLAATLKDYMRFRHFFRHSYTFELDWAKMRPLVSGLAGAFARLRVALAQVGC
jgi:hypothetical protein